MVALDLCKQIPPSEHRQIFFCLSGRNGSLSAEFQAAGAVVVSLGLRPFTTFPGRFFKALRIAKPDVVVSHVSLASAWLLLICGLVGVRKRQVRIHSDGDDHGSGAIRTVYRSASRLMLLVSSTDVVGVTTASLNFAVGRFAFLFHLFGRKLIVVPNGVDAAKFHPGSMGVSRVSSHRVLYVGRASPEKNRRLLMPVWRELVSRGFAGGMYVAGSDDVSDLESAVPEEVEILGDRSDVNELMRSASVLILTSVREGLPTVVLEALASGLPVVSSDLPGVRAIQEMTPGVSTVSLESPPSAWADAVLEAVDRGDEYRDQIRQGFLLSPYALEGSVAGWRRLWTG